MAAAAARTEPYGVRVGVLCCGGAASSAWVVGDWAGVASTKAMAGVTLAMVAGMALAMATGVASAAALTTEEAGSTATTGAAAARQ